MSSDSGFGAACRPRASRGQMQGAGRWHSSFIQALLERDIPQWGVRAPAISLLRFWTMLAHYHGQTWNAAEPARALGVSESTTRRHLDLLSDALVVRQLPPFHANIGKRQVKAPKIYIRDTGLLHQLLGIGTQKDLLRHPKVGASWKGFVVEQVLLAEPHDEAFSWSTHHGAEIDLVLRRGDRLFGVECKRTDAPRMTPSIRIATEDVGALRGRRALIGDRAVPSRRRGRGRPGAGSYKRNIDLLGTFAAPPFWSRSACHRMNAFMASARGPWATRPYGASRQLVSTSSCRTPLQTCCGRRLTAAASSTTCGDAPPRRMASRPS